jgi:predicted ATPase/DNA-binding CsgD family transcriptional regulator
MKGERSKPKPTEMTDPDSHGGAKFSNDLTWREQEVLLLLAERMSNREIADNLHLAESTVKDYVSNILSKLYVKNRRQAVERAQELGLLGDQRKPSQRVRTKLPPDATPFVGRQADLDQIQEHLAATRILTLVGPGGAGKTRLAIKTARMICDTFKDGCFFIALTPIRETGEIVRTSAEALQFPLTTNEDPQTQLLRFLQDKQLLLVMDNFEHLLDGVDVVNEIFQAAPGVKIISTSRERLNLQVETVLHVDGLAFPDRQDLIEYQKFDAINLFVQNARKVRPGFDPSDAEYSHIANICRSVEGMPLAIELAAAWLHMLSVSEIEAELEKGLDILSGELRDAPQRHRSIRAVFDHSWKLLEASEQEVVEKLSVFRGGFSRRAAQQVTGAGLTQLAGLVDKSFIHLDPESGRLELHELLRQYVQEKLETDPDAFNSVLEAHALFYAQFMHDRWEHLKGKDQIQALEEIEKDIENVRAAWRYFLDQKNSRQLLKFIYAFWLVHWIRGWNLAGSQLFAEAVSALEGEQDDESKALRALAMANQAYFISWLGLMDKGLELTQEALHVLVQLDIYPSGLVIAYSGRLINLYFARRYEEQVVLTQVLMDAASRTGDQWLIAYSMWAFNLSLFIKRDFSRAREIAEKNLQMVTEIGDEISATLPLISLGHAAFGLGDYEKAKEHYSHCLELSRKTGFHYSMQTSSKYLGKVNLILGNLDEANRYILECLAATNEVGFVRDVINLLADYAGLLAARGKLVEAVELLALVLEHPASNDFRMLEGRIRDTAGELLEVLRFQLTAEEFDSALKRGQELLLENVVSEIIKRRSAYSNPH